MYKMGCGIAWFEEPENHLNAKLEVLRPKCSSLVFYAPPTKTSYTTPHYHPKYEMKVKDFFMLEGFLKLILTLL